MTFPAQFGGGYFKGCQPQKIEPTTPRDTLSKAYQYKLIADEEIWLKMLDDRNNSSHAYKEEEAKVIFEQIKNYLPIFKQTYQKLKNNKEFT